MQHRSRTKRSGQGTTPSPTAAEHVQRARIQHELAQLPPKARALLARTHLAGAALAAVAIAVTLDPGSQAWIVSRLIAAYPWAIGHLLSLGATQEDALEIAQTSILNALSKASTFDPSRAAGGDAVRAWLGGYLRNVWLDRLRWRRTRREIPLDRAPQDEIAVPSHEGQAEAGDLLHALQAATTPERWRAWHAHEVELDTTDEIAAREQVPATTIEARIRDARRDLDRVLRSFGRKLRTRRTKGGA